MEGDGEYPRLVNETRARMRKYIETGFADLERAEKYALDAGRKAAFAWLHDLPDYRFKRFEDVPDDIARDFVSWHLAGSGTKSST